MTVKEQLLTLLEENRAANDWLSGEALAARLGVSRSAVWKAAQALNADGFVLESVPRRGYRLSAQADTLSAPGIRAALGPDADCFSLQVYRTLGSTNQTARQAAADGAPEGLVVLAESQNAGRGRLGRSFFSPDGTGLYLSVLLRPTLEADRAVLLTTAAAAAVCEAIAEVTGKQAQIKWVNDIFLDGKKVCGILTEAAFGTENGRLDYAVTGIGVNVCPPPGGFPPALADIAGSVLEAPPAGGLRNRLAAAILRRFLAYYRRLPERTFLAEYRRRSLVIGQQILIVRGDESRPALALGIDDDCHLLVRTPDGTQECLSTGEISIRLPH